MAFSNKTNGLSLSPGDPGSNLAGTILGQDLIVEIDYKNEIINDDEA